MNGIGKVLMVVLVALYVISPIDLVPGPVDDFIVILLSAATAYTKNKIASKTE